MTRKPKDVLGLTEDDCTLRVVQVRRGPTVNRGIQRRPRIIKESVSGWYHRCEWCKLWFVPAKWNQRFCDYRCRHSSFRERRRGELETLRKKVKAYEEEAGAPSAQSAVAGHPE
jgi:hypothetical protein